MRSNRRPLEYGYDQIAALEAANDNQGTIYSVDSSPISTAARERLGPVGCGVANAISYLLPVSMVAVGSYHTSDCPREPEIPVYLIVGGACAITHAVLRTLIADKKNVLVLILALFLFVWFMFGSYWIFSAFKPSFNKEDGNKYCHPLLYIFAFTITVVEHIFFIGFVIFMCTVCCKVRDEV